jgi:glutathione S-transferase
VSLDNAALTIFGDSISGNCLKVKFVADHLGIAHEWVETSVLEKETRTPEFLAMNPAGQVPVAMFAGFGPLA